MMIPAAPEGTPTPEVPIDSSKHKLNSTVDVWHHYALPADIAVEPVKEHH